MVRAPGHRLRVPDERVTRQPVRLRLVQVRVDARAADHRQQVLRVVVGVDVAGQDPDLVPERVQVEELVGPRILRVAAVDDVGEPRRAVHEPHLEDEPEAVTSDRPHRVLPGDARLRRAVPDVEAPEVVEVGRGRVAVVAVVAVVVDQREVLGVAARGVDGRVARLQPDGRFLGRQEAAVLGRVLLVALVDDEVDRLRRVLDAHEPVGAVVVDPVGQLRRRPVGRLGGIDRVAPEVEAPAGVDAVGTVVAQLDVALRRRPRRVDGRVARLQPDLRRLLRVEEAVGTAVRVLRVALVDDEADLGGVRCELHPGEAAELVLAVERLRRRPGHVGLVHVAPHVDAPAVVGAVGPLVVDDGVVAGGARLRRLDLADDRRRRVGVEVAGAVARDRLDLERRARREPGDVVEDPVGRVVVGAEHGPLGRRARLERERDLGELRPVEDGLELDVADDLGALGGLRQRHDRVARARRAAPRPRGRRRRRAPARSAAAGPRRRSSPPRRRRRRT